MRMILSMNDRGSPDHARRSLAKCADPTRSVRTPRERHLLFARSYESGRCTYGEQLDQLGRVAHK